MLAAGVGPVKARSSRSLPVLQDTASPDLLGLFLEPHTRPANVGRLPEA